MIALCNPKNIRFDSHEPLTKQITVPADTLSRFDLVFKIEDIPDKEKDRAIAEHQARQWARYEEGSQDEQTEDNEISQEKLSKYLQYARTIKPRTSPEIRKAIIDYYLTLRIPNENEPIAATARQNNGLYRLTKAMAKLRLSNECTIEDVNQAINIYQASMEAIRDPKTGKIDSDIILGSGKSQRDRVKQIREIVEDLQGSNGSAAYFEDIISLAAKVHIRRDQVINDLQHLKQQGDIIEVSNGFFKSF